VAGRVIDRLIYGFHPYGLPGSGTAESLAGLTRQDFLDFHRSYYVPNNALIAIVGDITPDEAMAGVEKHFGAWKAGDVPPLKPIDPPQPTKRVVVIDKKGSVQTEIRVGQLANNVGVDMCHVNGRLYEQEELIYCRTKVKPRVAIVDVGANTGNHLIFFAGFLDPSIIVPVEIHPEAIRQLRENIALNGITCVDDRCLGVGAGDSHGRYTRVEDVDLAQAALAPSVNGDIKVAPLDDLVTIPVGFVKIDVEGMEIEVLNGARRLISTCQPQILIEVQERNIEPFRKLAGQLGYVVDREFAHAGYTNYFLNPPR